MNEALNDLQFRLLDALYFVEPFERIAEEMEAPVPIIIDEIRILIDKGWIQVMEFDKGVGDYLRTLYYDSDHMDEYSYLITKDGLMMHNGHG